MNAGDLPTDMLHALEGGLCLTIDELDARLDFTRRQISDAVCKLILRGWAERIERGCYQLTAAGVEARKSGVVIKPGPYRRDTGRARRPWANTLRQRAWTAMRMSRTFTVGDLVMAAAQPEDTEPEGNIQRYIRALVLGGYAAELPIRARGTALTSNGFKRFRLIRDSGPAAPIVRTRSKVIFDHNTGEALPCRALP